MSQTVKERLLEQLESHRGQMLSGEELARDLGVSRTAIWKGIHSLLEEGYDILSVKKSGYQLQENSDILSVFRIRQGLEDRDLLRVEVYKTVDSTNRRVLEAALSGEREWLAVAAEAQTGGVGHRQRAFGSPSGKGVYMSVLLRPQCGFPQMGFLEKAAVLAAAEALEGQTGQEMRIRHPGDILWHGQKVCGVLTQVLAEWESQAVEAAAIGIGVNVYGGEGMDPELPVSLYDMTGRYHNRSDLIAGILNHMRLCFQEEPDSLESRYNGKRMEPSS